MRSMFSVGVGASRAFVSNPWLVRASYVVAFLLLDWVSYIRPMQGLNITPWNPQPALAVALLLWNGRSLWLVCVGLVAAELAVRGVPHDWFVTLAFTLALSFVYAAMARVLLLRTDRGLALATRRDLLWLAAVSLAGSLLAGLVYVAIHAAAGVTGRTPFGEAVLRYWVGDAVGVLVLLPALLALMDPRRRVELLNAVRSRQWWLISTLVVALLWLVFGLADQDRFKFFYLLLLPVVWASAALGVAGAVLTTALVQLGLIAALQSVPSPDLMVLEFQVLMAAITMTALVLGVASDERMRAAAELNLSLRMAAAGQMAAGLAHELSQPLTALTSYAQSCRLIVAASDRSIDDRQRQLIDVVQRMSDDALRAGDVVKRLRDFFRSGTTQLRWVSVAALLHEGMAAQGARAGSLGVELSAHVDADLPPAQIDPVQIGVVVRNLLANALDAAGAGNVPRRVRVRATRSVGEVLVEVSDSGAGVSTERAPQLFAGGGSDKADGMGIGLSICRAIVEAHGGRLWVESGAGGLFRFTLPAAAHDTREASHAP
jgi:two-component system sensor kinase FixL